MNRKLLYAIFGLGVLVAAGFMVSSALRTSLVYFVLPSEYARDADSFQNRNLRLGGLVKVGSVHFDEEHLKLHFVITDDLQDYNVTYDGAPPDLFMENGGVVIEGKFDSAGTFVGDNLLVKHSNDYQAPPEGEPIDIEALKKSLT